MQPFQVDLVLNTFPIMFFFLGFPFQTLFAEAAEELKAALLEQLEQDPQDTVQEGEDKEVQEQKPESAETLLDQPEGESQGVGEEETQKGNDDDDDNDRVCEDQYAALGEVYPDNQLGLWDWSPEKVPEVPIRPVTTPVRSRQPVFTESPDLQNKAYMRNRETREALTPTELEQSDGGEVGEVTHDDYLQRVESDLEQELDQTIEDDGIREP